MIELRTLGELCLQADGRVLSTRPTELALLVYVLRRTTAPTRAELAELLWPDRDARRARHSLRQALVHLRQLLGEEIVSPGDPVHIDRTALLLDVVALESDVAAGRLRAAVERYAGEFLRDADGLGDDTFRTWLEAERESLRVRVAWCCEQLALEAERSGHLREAVQHAQRWTELQPLDERAHERLVEALRRTGQIAEAKARCTSFASRHQQELGVPPSPSFAALAATLEGAALRRGRLGMGSGPIVTATDAGESEPLMRELLGAWQSARQGAAGIAIVEVEAGPACITLCDELHERVRAIDPAALVLHARCTDATPCIGQLLAPLRTARGLGGAPDAQLAEVAAVVPAIRERYPLLPPFEGDVGTGAIVRVLRDIAAEQPILLIIDGIAAADALTQRLVRALERTRDAAILVVVTTPAAGLDSDVLRELRSAPSVRRHTLVAGRSPVPVSPVSPVSPSSATPRRRRRRTMVATALFAAVMLVAFSVRVARTTSADGPVAVGRIVDHAGDQAVATVLPDMLATGLARTGELSVVSNARLRDVHAQLLRGDVTTPLARAAALTGARELVEGSLYVVPGGLRLELTRVDLRSGRVRAAYQVEGANAFELADRASRAMLPRPQGAPSGLADVTTSSLVAYRMYAEGLHAYYDGDVLSARRLFEAALAEDSTFTMATYYLALTLEAIGEAGMSALLQRAARRAGRASDRERLLVNTAWADMMEEPVSLRLADSLAARYPLEPDGHYFLGRARVQRGDFLAAVPHLRRVIEMDSLALGRGRAQCRACDAYAQLVAAWTYADSFATAESVAREWTRRQPTSSRAWNALATVLEYRDRYSEARDARRAAAPLQPGHRMVPIYPALVDIRAGDFASADRLLLDAMRTGAPAVAQEARWFLAISLRYQGRLREALATARPLRDSAPGVDGAPSYASVLEAQVLFELGRYREAAALFDSLAATYPLETAGMRSRRDRRAWLLAHVATARHAAGDTAALRPLADEIEALGRLSALGRDQRLHHYVRGLLHSSRGEREQAVLSMRNAIYSVTGGNFTRTSYELGRLLLELDRPAEAVAVLRPALAGPLESANLYLSRTELRALLGRAWDAAGEPDSAQLHYRWVVNAWQQADPLLRVRRDSIAALLR